MLRRHEMQRVSRHDEQEMVKRVPDPLSLAQEKLGGSIAKDQRRYP